MPSTTFFHKERLLTMAGAVLLGVFFLYLGWSDRQERNFSWEQQLASQAVIQRLAVSQSQQAVRRQALMAAETLAEDPDTQRLIRRIALLAQRDGLDSPTLIQLRAQLADDLSGFWKVLEESGANQLHVHLAPGGVSLLRMHAPTSWGDSLIETRSMIAEVQRRGIGQSGMEPSRFGSGMRGIVPVRLTSHPGSSVVASLEVGFGMLPELRQLDQELDSGLALLLNHTLLREVGWESEAPELLALNGESWWLEQYSRTEVLTWLQSGNWSGLQESDVPLTLSIDDRHFLVMQIPVASYQTDDSNLLLNPAAKILVWRDITALWQEHVEDSQRALVSWTLAFLAALALLLGLMLGTQHSVRQREQIHLRRLSDEVRQRERDRLLLDVIAQAQSAYISASNLHDSFDRLLEQILALSGSRFGFVGEVRRDGKGQRYLQTHAISTIRRDPQNGNEQRERLPHGKGFSNLDSLAEPVLLHAQPCINNAPTQPLDDLPAGHPELGTFLGLPILFRNELVGMIGLANRESGYDEADVSYLAPLLQTLGQLIQALRKDGEERSIRRRLEQQRQALRALNEITALPSLDTSVRLKEALELGCQYLSMDHGIVSQIQDNSYLVLAQHSPDGVLREGEHFELGSTYCALTLQHEDVLAIEFMGESRFKGHPCYGRHGLESYIGVALVVNNQRYGTLNFSAKAARKYPFGETDLEFVRLMGRWVSSSLSRWGMEQEQKRILERFKKLTEHLPGVVYQYQQDADGHSWFPYSSHGLWDVCGVTPEQAREDAALVIQATHPEDLQAVLDSIAASTRDLSLWQCEYRVMHPQRGELWMAGRARPEQLADGAIVWHGFITDVTLRKQMELSLERERERLANIIQATNIGTWEWNVQTGETLLNERWAGIVGYRLEELQPLTIDVWRSLAHPDDLTRSGKLLKRHFDGELNYYECKSRMRHKNGEWVWINSRGRLIRRDEQGQPLWMSGTHADITTEMRRDAEITQARAFLHAVIDASTEVSVITTDLDGVITLFNSGAEKLLGYKAEDMIGQHKATHFHLPAEVERRAANLSREAGQAISDVEVFFFNVRQGQAETLPWTYVHRDGTQRLVNLTVSGIVDEHQQLNGFLLIGTDITDLIQATRALQKSESRFRSMVSNLPGAVYRCNSDTDWSMSYMSEEIAAITGYPASDFIDNKQRSFASIIHPDDLHLTYQVIEQVERQQAYELNYRIVHAQGHEVWVREKGRGDYNSRGELLWLSGFIWDATEQHKIDQMKSQFVSTVSHELRTPLTSITGSLALINNGVLGSVPESMRKLLQIAHGNSMQLNSLINDLLDMDKLEAGKMRFNLQPQPLAPLLLKALDSNASYATQFQVKLELGQVDPVRVTVDALRLGQILNNYLSNAIKFSHAGDAVLLEAYYEQGKVRIRVTDKGLGIAADFHGQIFSKFSQADATDTRQRGGTGLGLAICRELAERMHGEVGFESEVGQGSSFWCLLDAQLMEDREA